MSCGIHGTEKAEIVRRVSGPPDMKAAFVIGRMLLGGFFVYNGINHFQHTEALAQYAGAKKVPNPDRAVRASGAAMLAGGASLILGVKPRYGVLPLAVFLSVVSPMMHDFWNADPQAKQNEMIHFAKNMALLGAVLMLTGVEEWPASLSA